MITTARCWWVGFVAMFALGTTAQATSMTFDYSYTFSSTDVVSGSFKGTASGNLITNLSNITAAFDGIPLIGSGSLYNAGLDPTLSFFINNAAVVSFDGTQNNFIFSNVPNPSLFSPPTDFFFSIGGPVLSAAISSAVGGTFVAADAPFNPSEWTVTAVPEPGTLSLLGLGLAGVGFMRRRKAA